MRWSAVGMHNGVGSTGMLTFPGQITTRDSLNSHVPLTLATLMHIRVLRVGNDNAWRSLRTHMHVTFRRLE